MWLLGRGKTGWVGEGQFLEIGTLNAKLSIIPWMVGTGIRWVSEVGELTELLEARGGGVSAIPAL